MVSISANTWSWVHRPCRRARSRRKVACLAGLMFLFLYSRSSVSFSSANRSGPICFNKADVHCVILWRREWSCFEQDKAKNNTIKTDQLQLDGLMQAVARFWRDSRSPVPTQKLVINAPPPPNIHTLPPSTHKQFMD